MNPDLTEPLLILAIALASAITGYLFRSRCELDIWQRGYNAGLHRYHTHDTTQILPKAPNK
jgi:hypothetical protein